MVPRSAGLANFEDLDGFLLGTTINPAQLHFGSPSMQQYGSPTSPFGPYSGVDSTYYSVDDDEGDGFDWMMTVPIMPEPVDQSSPSAFSNGSGGGDGAVGLNDPVWNPSSMNGHGSSMPFSDFRTPNFSGTPPPGTVPYNR